MEIPRFVHLLVMKPSIDILFKDEVYNIVNAVLEVHNILGPGFLENVYQQALQFELTSRKIPYASQVKLPVYYKDTTLLCYYIPDLLAWGEIIIEIKAIRKCTDVEIAQVINSLKTSNKRLGLLINFGEPSLYWKRIIL